MKTGAADARRAPRFFHKGVKRRADVDKSWIGS